MKKFLTLILALTLLLLCGCSGEISKDPTETDTASVPSSASIDYHQEILSRMYPIPEYNTDPLLEYDPDRQIYISLANQSCDFYPEYYFLGETFWIITREHYDVSQISVRIPSQTKYEVQVLDKTDRVSTTQINGGDGLYCLLFQQHFTMQGADWKQLAEEVLYEEIARELASGYERDSEEYNGYIRAIEENTSGLWWKYEAQYDKLTNEELPKFSAYRVFITFLDLGSYEETIETVDVTVGTETYSVDIGQWRLHTEIPEEVNTALSPPGLEGDSVTTAYGGPPNADGYAVLSDATVFHALEDLTILGYRQLETPVGELPLIGARVKYMEKNEDNAWVPVMDYYWDTRQPLNIAKGSRVFIDLFLKDDRFTQYEFCYTVNFFLQYELRGKVYEKVSAHNINCAHNNIWDTYLMAFEGIDTGEFYASYHIPMNWDWLREVPKEWLE